MPGDDASVCVIRAVFTLDGVLIGGEGGGGLLEVTVWMMSPAEISSGEGVPLAGGGGGGLPAGIDCVTTTSAAGGLGGIPGGVDGGIPGGVDGALSSSSEGGG